ncbi:MAG TPA: aldo/keto reductase, partial [Pseudonocardiaceae bacterium]|nr:aldo/keto reductase [Pseudonocardiaceae bacterium]
AGRPTASPGQIRIELDGSLRRLGTDHVDLYHQHAPDPMTPWAEILGTLDDLTAEGKVRFACCSNVSGDQITTAAGIAADEGLRGFVAVQNEYNVLRPKAATDSLPACSALGLGFLAYFPLAGGLLTGASTRSERSTVARTANRRHLGPDTIAAVRALERAAAQRLGRSLLEVAIAAVLRHPAVTGVLVGATTARHVHENVTAACWQPSADELDGLSELHELVRGVR